MKTRILLIVLFALSFSWLSAQLPGSTCENPLNVDPVNTPLVNFAINSENYGNDYTATMVTPSSNYLNGNDIVFAFSLSAKSYIYSSIQGEWAGLTFVATCPNLATPAPRLAFAGGSTGATVATFTLEAGSYFMIAGTYPPPVFANMVINFSAVPVPLDPSLIATPADLFVGWATPGFYSVSKTISLSNQGIADIIIAEGGMTFTGANAADYSVALATGDTYPLTIPFGQSKVITVTFNPLAAGNSTANLEINYNNPVNPIKSVPVSGLGYLPLSNFSQYFDGVTPVPTGWMPDGWNSLVQSSNTSAYVRVLTSTPFSPPNQVTFASSTDLNAKLILVSPTATNFNNSRVYFTARMGTSTHTGKVQVGYLTSRTDPATFVSAAEVPITGSWQLYSVSLGNTGVTFPENAYIGIRYVPEVTNRLAVIDNFIYELVPTQPIFNANQMSFNFGSTTWMYESSTQLLQIYNSGVGQLRINEGGIQIAGADPSFFTVEYPQGHTWPIALEFGQAINLTLRFSPLEGRTYNALLNITDNVTGKALNTITLTGTGYDAIIEPGFLFDFTGTFPPKDWRRYIGLFGTEIPTITTTSVWVHRKFANVAALPANNSAGINIFGTGRKHWLMSPPIDLGDGSQNYQLEFDLALTAKNTTTPANFGPEQKFGVVISTDGGRTWSTENVLQWWNSSTSISNTGERIFIDLTGYTGRVMFGFYGESTVTGGDVDLFFRNVEVNEFVPLTQLPLNEDFESPSFPPQNWTIYELGNNKSGWASSSANNHTSGGEKSAFHSKGAQGVQEDGWLVSPLLQIPAQGPILLKFWSFNNEPLAYGKNSVLVSTGSADPEDEDYVEVWAAGSVTAGWVETTVDLTAYTNQTIYVAFRYEGNNAHDWFVDDVQLFVDTSPVIAVTPESISKLQVPGITSSAIVKVTNNGIDNLVYDIGFEYLTGAEGWLSANPVSGNLQGGGFNQNHSIFFNSTGLQPGVYTANILVNSNDPENPVVSIPATLTLNEPTLIEVKTLINQYTFPQDVSQDGKYVLITAFGGSSNWLWSESAGLKSIAGNSPSVSGVSDAGIVNGSFKDPNLLYNGNPVQVAGTWNPATEQWTFLGMNPLAPTFFSTSYQSGYGISADGQTQAGMQYLTGTSYKAFTWTETGGYNTIGASYSFGNRPNGLNKNGTVVYGWAQTATLSRSPAIWVNGELILISPTLSGEARGASASGNFVTGSSGQQGFLWSPDRGTIFFSNTLNDGSVQPTSVLADGTVFGFTAQGFPALPPGRRAFVRYIDGTMITFNDYATQRGLPDAELWLFYSINGVTPDGTKFIGAGINPQGQAVSFLIDFDVEVPAISIDPAELNETLAPGQTSQQSLTIENTGSLELEYTAIIVNPSSPDKKSSSQVPEGIIQPASGIELSVAKTGGGDASENRAGYSYVLHYDGPNANAIGLTAGGEFYTAARYPAEMVYLFEGSTIQSVDVYVNSMPTRANIHIYGPGTTTSPGTLLYQQSFTPVANSWNTVVLTTPYTLTGEDFWVGCKYEHAPQVWVAGIDGGPTNINGNFLSNNGTTWERLSNYGFVGNWNIRSLLQLPNLEWLSISPASGNVEPGQSQDIQVSYDADGLEEGEYNANIVIFSNDPQNGTSFVPVELVVAFPEANILAYAFNAAQNASLFSDAIGQVDLLNHTVTVELPQNADLTDLIATFSLSEGVSAQVAGVNQISGVTPNDFTAPVVYTLTTSAQTTQDWAVIVTTVPCNSPWEYIITGTTHTISIPAAIAPEIFGAPLAQYDWIGVFYLNEEGEEICGGAVQWNGTENIAMIAYGNDPTTPGKDGFASGEPFLWKLSQCGNPVEYTAIATYDPTFPNQGNFAGFGLSKLTSLKAALIQYYMLNEGWNSISSYIHPFDADVEVMFAPIVTDLTILSNLTSVYWPSQGINTIVDWNQNSGYVTKVTEDVDFMIAGQSFVSGTITIPAGWSYLPVLSQCPANVMDMFIGNLSDVVIIQELIGTKIFWPQFEVYSLVTFESGKAYKIKLANPVTVTFPECDGLKSNITPSSTFNSINTNWGTIKMTPATQSVVFLSQSLVDFADGDMIGAFDQSGKIWGYARISSNNQNQTITLFGDDVYSMEKDGFATGEEVVYKMLRSATGEVIDLQVEYDQTMDNATGAYFSNSFAAITNVTMLPTSLENLSTNAVNMYPNPARNVVHFSVGASNTESVSVILSDSKGVVVAQENFISGTTLNTRNLNPGVYFVQIRTNNAQEVRKLVIQ